MMTNRLLITAGVLSAALGYACGGDDDGGHDPDRPFGETAIVVVVNPTPNDLNTAAVPGIAGDLREDVAIDAEPGGGARPTPPRPRWPRRSGPTATSSSSRTASTPAIC